MTLSSLTDRLRAPISKLIWASAGPSGVRIIGQSMVSATNLAVALLVVWAYGASVFGVYSFFALIALLITNVLIAAFVEPAALLVAKMEGGQRRSYFAALAVSFAILAVLSLVPLHFALGLAAAFFLQSASVDTFLVTALVVALVSVQLLRAFLQAYAEGFVLLGSDTLKSALSMTGLLVAVLASIYGPEYDPYVTVIGLQLLAMAAYLAVAVIFAAAKRWYARPDFASFETHRARSRLTTATALVRFLQVNAPLFWAQYILGEQVFGVIRTYQTIANLVSLPLNALRLNNISRSAVAFASGGTQTLVSYVLGFLTKLALTTLAAGLAVLTVLALLPDDMRPNAEGFLYISFFLAAAVVAAVNVSLSAYFYANGRLMPLLLMSLAGAMIAIALTPLLIQYIGGIGAPVAVLVVLSSVSTTTMLFIHWESRHEQSI